MTTPDIPSGAPSTSSASSSLPPPGAKLILVDLTNKSECDTLLEQREICGWGSDRLPGWINLTAKGHLHLFWIALPGTFELKSTEAVGSVTREDTTYHGIGHVAIERVHTPYDETFEPDLSLANPDGSVLTISSLFVLPTVKGLRLGAFAMDECERMVQQEPYGSLNCEAVTVNTLSSRYHANGIEGPDGMGRWALLGMPNPKMDNALWYARRGYVKFCEEPMYTSTLPDQTTISWYGSKMRKELPSKKK